MIVVETFTIDNREYTRTYSDQNRYVVRDGISYEEACDPIEFNRSYEEGDVINDSESTASEILDILMGGTA